MVHVLLIRMQQTTKNGRDYGESLQVRHIYMMFGLPPDGAILRVHTRCLCADINPLASVQTTIHFFPRRARRVWDRALALQPESGCLCLLFCPPPS